MMLLCWNQRIDSNWTNDVRNGLMEICVLTIPYTVHYQV